MNTVIHDRYLLASDFDQRAVNIKFPPGVWSIAAALADVSEATSSMELERISGQSPDQVLNALDRLLDKKLVHQNLMSWEEFTTTKIISVVKPNIPVAVEILPPVSVKPNKPSDPNSVPSPTSVSLRLGSILRQQAVTVGATAWVSQKPDPVQVSASKPAVAVTTVNGGQPNGRLLRPILAQIENLKGAGVEGQLLIYQVFLRVPYQLLHDEGIKALHFVDEQTVIKNPALLAAIVKAAKEVTGVDLE